MYESIRVRNFRSFTDLRLEGLARFNLIGGKNNVGKTALMEALALLHGIPLGKVVDDLRKGVVRERGLAYETHKIWEEINLLFPKGDLEQMIEVSVQERSEGVQVTHTLEVKSVKWDEVEEDLREALIRSQGLLSLFIGDSLLQRPDQIFLLEYRREGQTYRSFVAIRGKRSYVTEGWSAPFPVSYRGARVRFLDENVIANFGELMKARGEEMVFKFLRVIEPDLEEVLVLTDYDDHEPFSVLYGALRNFPRLVPLHVMGDGMIRLVDLAIRLGNAQNGILLIDEFENGLHWSILPQVWRAFKETARRLNVQVFATTHSYECIQAAHQAFSEDALYDFRFYRLERTEQEGIQAVAFDRETLSTALEMGWEVR